AAQLPAGQLATDSSSTRFVESKKPPPLLSPPSAYSLLVPASYANPKSALACAKAGPVVHTPGAELMSKRSEVALFASGTLGCSDCWPLFSIELSDTLACLDCKPLFNTELICAPLPGPFGVAPNPPITYR